VKIKEISKELINKRMNNNIKREEIMGVKEGEIMGSNFSRDDKDRILK